MAEVILESEVTCPHCNMKRIETMPTTACQWFYECPECHEILHPKEGDCCIYCSYGTVACPPIQLEPNKKCCDKLFK